MRACKRVPPEGVERLPALSISLYPVGAKNRSLFEAARDFSRTLQTEGLTGPHAFIHCMSFLYTIDSVKRRSS